jgi:hypothetical protein
MHLDGSLKTVSAFAEPQQFESIRQHIDPAWVAEALAATGTATVRGAGRCCAVRGGARNLVERNLVEIALASASALPLAPSAATVILARVFTSPGSRPADCTGGLPSGARDHARPTHPARFARPSSPCSRRRQSSVRSLPKAGNTRAE